jgi:hypothetical protein
MTASPLIDALVGRGSHMVFINLMDVPSGFVHAGKAGTLSIRFVTRSP